MADSAARDHVVRRWRRQQKPRVSLETLAGKAEISKATLSRIESGKLPLTIEVAKKLATATGLPLRVLCPDLAKMFDVAAPSAAAQPEAAR